jgi:hypothetical protein
VSGSDWRLVGRTTEGDFNVEMKDAHFPWFHYAGNQRCGTEDCIYIDVNDKPSG